MGPGKLIYLHEDTNVVGSHKQKERVSPARAWWTVAVIFLAGILANIDRAILSLLIPAIQSDFAITDTQIGLLSGVAFAVFYSTLGMPIARASDRGSRRLIIACGVAVWSVATAASGFATRFSHLFLARMGVGVGEAVLTPATVSLIADLFPKEQRGFALGAVGAANYIGGGLALLLGSIAIAAAATLVPLWGITEPWKIVFLIVGLPGVLVALLMLTVAEPPRGHERDGETGSWAELMAFLSARRWVLGCHFLGFSLEGAIAYAVAVWAPTFFVRNFQMTAAEAGLMLGPFLLVGGPLGGLIGGWLLQRWSKAGHDSAPMIAGLLGSAVVCLAVGLAPLMPTPLLSALFFGISFTFGPIAALGAFAAIQLIAPARLRAQVVAIYYFVVTMISIMGGASIIAYFTDNVFHDPAAIGRSISLTALLLGPFCVLVLWLALAPYARAAREAPAS